MLETIAQFDQQLFLTLNNDFRSLFGDIFLGYTTWLGDGFVLYIVGFLISWKWDRPHLKRNAVLLLVAVLLAGLCAHFLKEHFQRLRPLGKFGGWKGDGFWDSGPNETYHVMFRPLMYKSFPSGHCLATFSAVSLFSSLYPRRTFLFIFVGIVVMISRVYVGAHFPLDTVAGALLGTALGYFIYRIHPVLLSRLWGDAGAVKRTRL